MEVDVSSQIAAFNEFFTTIYKSKIDDLLRIYPTQRSIFVTYTDLEKFDPDLADALVRSPDLIVDAAEEAIKQLNLKVPAGNDFTPHVRFVDVPSEDKLIEQLSSRNINELVAFKCVVTKRAEVMHRVKVAMYKCQLCDAEMKLFISKNFTPPKRCESCKKYALRQVDEESTFTDIQKAEVQELLERIRGGAPAAHIELVLEDDLVNKLAPGDNVDVVGVLRLRPPLKMRQKQELIYGRFVEANSVRSLKKDFEEIEITKEEERRLKELAKNPEIDSIIHRSIAPSIYGHNEVKKALALQLFGGTRGKTMKGGMPIRDDIHVLLIGDPGIAKSRFLQSVSGIAPKSIYVSGKSVSGAGLTVAAEKDELGEGGWTLKAGALVLASGGTAQVDEFDKIEDEDRAALHEAMETGTISVAKAGIVAKFRAKTAILAAANPKYGRFDQTKNLADQFDVPPTLLSIAADEPLVIREKGTIKTMKIGEFVDRHYNGSESGMPKKAGAIEVLSFNRKTMKVGWKSIKYVFRHAYGKPLQKLILESGREVKVTPGHSVFVFKDSRIIPVPSDKLGEGDFVVIPKRLPREVNGQKEINLARELLERGITKDIFIHGISKDAIRRFGNLPKHWIKDGKLPLRYAEKLSDDELGSCGLKCKGGSPRPVPVMIPVQDGLMRLLGYYIAEGSLLISGSRSHLLSFCFNWNEKDLREDTKQIIFQLFNQEASILRDKNSAKVNIGNKIIYHLLHDILRVGQNAYRKKVPDIVFNVQPHLKRHFLRAWFDGDGGVTVSRELISDVLYLLLTMDVLGTTSHDAKEGVAFIKGRPVRSHGFYKLVSPRLPSFENRGFYSYPPLSEMADTIRSISDSNYAQAFRGIRPETKSNRRSATPRWWSEFFSDRISYRAEQLGYFMEPHSVREYEDDFQLTREGGRTFVKKWFGRGLLKADRRVLDKGGFQRFYSISERGQKALDCMDFANRFLDGDLGLARIKKIEGAETSPYVYDISVEEDENFVAGLGGVICHNSRFDLIFPIVDVLDEEKDAKLAEHILSTHMGTEAGDGEVFDKDLLRKYIAYARRKVFPKLGKEASQKIKEFYVDLRRKSKDAGAVAITPRYLEGLVRLAEANAKMRLKDSVDEEDADVAISLFNYVMMQILTDKVTGAFDVDVVTTGKPKSTRDKMQREDTILDIIREHLRRTDTADVKEVVGDAKSYDIDETAAHKIISELLRRGVIYEKEYGHIKIVGE